MKINLDKFTYTTKTLKIEEFFTPFSGYGGRK